MGREDTIDEEQGEKLGLTERIKMGQGSPPSQTSVWKKLCCGTSSRSSGKSIKSDNKESGLTVGLILKDYSEYLGVKALMWNIVILSLIFSSIEYTYDGGQTSTLKAKSLSTFTIDGDGNNVISTNSAYASGEFYAKRLQAVVNSQFDSKDHSNDNDINIGRYGSVRAACLIFNPIYWGTDNQKSLFNCRFGTPQEDPDCTHFANIMSRTASQTKLYSPIFEYFPPGPKGITGTWKRFNTSSIGFSMPFDRAYSATIFDTRHANWTLQNSKDAVDELVGVILPAYAPFVNFLAIELLIEDYWKPSSQEKEFGSRYGNKETFAGGSYHWLSLQGILNDVYTSSNPLFPRVVRIEQYSFGVFVGPPYVSGVRLALDLIILGCVSLSLLYEWNDMKLSILQDGSPWKYLNSHWNRLDIVCLVVTWVGYLTKLLILGGAPHMLSMSRKPFNRDDEDRTERTAVEAGGFKNFVDAGFILVMLVFCVRIFKFFRFHSALRVYIRFMEILAVQVEGFVVIFLGLIIMFARIFFALNRYSGNTDSFPSTSFSINEMLKITFGFTDYNAFINNGAGYGFLAGASLFAFWIAVFVLTVLAQNVILAIIGNAQESSRRPEGTSVGLLSYLTRIVTFNFWLLVYFVLFFINNSSHALFAVCRNWPSESKITPERDEKKGSVDAADATKKGLGIFCNAGIFTLISSLYSESKKNALDWLHHAYEIAMQSGKQSSLEQIWCTLLRHESVIERLSAMYLCTVYDTAIINQMKNINLVENTEIKIVYDICDVCSQMDRSNSQPTSIPTPTGKGNKDDDEEEEFTEFAFGDREILQLLSECDRGVVIKCVPGQHELTSQHHHLLNCCPSNTRYYSDVTIELKKNEEPEQNAKPSMGMDIEQQERVFHYVFRVESDYSKFLIEKAYCKGKPTKNSIDILDECDNLVPGIIVEAWDDKLQSVKVGTVVTHLPIPDDDKVWVKFEQDESTDPVQVEKSRVRSRVVLLEDTKVTRVCFGNVPSVAFDMFNVICDHKTLQTVLLSCCSHKGNDKDKYQLRGLFNSLSDEEIDEATRDLFVVYQHSVLHSTNRLLAKLRGEANRSVFETTDDMVEEAMNIRMAFAQGGFKSAITKQIDDVKKAVEDLSQKLPERSQAKQPRKSSVYPAQPAAAAAAAAAALATVGGAS